jgi:excisionase family DNA binding protein
MALPTRGAATLQGPILNAVALLDVQAVAALLGCSSRHVYRLSDAGRMPAPVRVGVLVRWRRGDLQDWIDGGCKPIRQASEN